MNRPSHRPAPRPRISSVVGLGLVAAALSGGCTKICDDDGFAWQQDELCQANASATDTAATDTDDTTTTATATATETATATATTTTTMGTMSETDGGGTLYCKDSDGDGFGDPDQCMNVPMGDEPPPGSVPNDDDCDDTNPNTFPGSAPLDDPNACMEDDDDDDHGDANPGGGGGGGGGPVPGSDACDDKPYAWMEATCATCNDDDMDGYWSGCDVYPDPKSDPRDPDFGDQFADCDDNDPNTFPGAAPLDDPNACMKDADDDDYGDDFGGMMPPPGVTPGSDCDDQNDHTFPGSAPLDDPNACMQDNDDDDHGDAKPDKPGVIVGTDCFDENPLLSPSNTRLMTGPTSVTQTANVSEIVAGDGVYDVVEYKTFDVSGFLSWRIESMSVNPVTSKVWGWLDDEGGRGLVEIDYCGGAPPQPPSPKLKNKRVCGISFMADGRLFGVDYSVDQFLEFSADGQEIINTKPLTLDGNLLNIGADCGMTYDCFEDRLILADSTTAGLYTLDTVTGAATLLAAPMAEFGGALALDPVKKELLSCLGADFMAIALADYAVTPLDPLSVASVNDLEYLPLCE